MFLWKPVDPWQQKKHEQWASTGQLMDCLSRQNSSLIRPKIQRNLKMTVFQEIIIIIIIIMIYCPKWKIRNGKSFLEILFAQLIVARQPLSSARSTLLYPFQMLSAKQGSSNSHLLTSFGMTRPGIEPTTSRLWGGRSTDWANTHRSQNRSQNLNYSTKFNDLGTILFCGRYSV